MGKVYRAKPLPELEQRIEDAQDDADEAFWAIIAERFPEAVSGDVDPGWVEARRQTNFNFVALWLKYNSPLDPPLQPSN